MTDLFFNYLSNVKFHFIATPSLTKILAELRVEFYGWSVK